jgi:hypothetical protein
LEWGSFLGVGSNVVGLGTDSQYDLHSDAAWSPALNAYLITVQTHSLGKLLLYSSSDGVQWKYEAVVDDVAPDWQPYSTFVTFDSDDGHVVGNPFDIIYARKSAVAYDVDELAKCTITIR